MQTDAPYTARIEGTRHRSGWLEAGANLDIRWRRMWYVGGEKSVPAQIALQTLDIDGWLAAEIASTSSIMGKWLADLVMAAIA
jgi:hypothetical protein